MSRRINRQWSRTAIFIIRRIIRQWKLTTRLLNNISEPLKIIVKYMRGQWNHTGFTFKRTEEPADWKPPVQKMRVLQEKRVS